MVRYPGNAPLGQLVTRMETLVLTENETVYLPLSCGYWLENHYGRVETREDTK